MLAAQPKVPFQIMIPACLPRQFDRTTVEIRVDTSGPGGGPTLQLVYRTKQGAAVTLVEGLMDSGTASGSTNLASVATTSIGAASGTQWSQIPAASRAIESKWGTGWYFVEGSKLAAVWVYVGATRVCVLTTDPDEVSGERLLTVANTLEPAWSTEAVSTDVPPTKIKDVAQSAPVNVPVNSDGVQALTLVVTPKGYSPSGFTVKKDVPVQITFRETGKLVCSCCDELIFPSDPAQPATLKLNSVSDQKVLTFTPAKEGTYPFYCPCQMEQGFFTVLP